MTIAPQRQKSLRGFDRLGAAVLVALIHVGLGLMLLYGLAPKLMPNAEQITRLVNISLVPPPPIVPPPPPPPPKVEPKAKPRPEAAAPAPVAPPGGTPSEVRRAAPPPPIVKLAPTAPAGGGVAGTGSGTSAGAGAGGGTGGDGAGTGDGYGGDGEGDGGTAAEQIAGEITSRDYPRDLFEAEVGGRVGIRFTISPAGRVSECEVTRSSGTPVLDQLTCRLIRERFRYRPATDGRGRAVEDEVEGVHAWVPRR
jgi:protein TonB